MLEDKTFLTITVKHFKCYNPSISWALQKPYRMKITKKKSIGKAWAFDLLSQILELNS